MSPEEDKWLKTHGFRRATKFGTPEFDIYSTEKYHVSAIEIRESLGIGRGSFRDSVRRGAVGPPDVSAPARKKATRPWKLLWDTDALIHKLSEQQQEVVEHSESYTPDLVEEMNHARLCVEVTQLLSWLSEREQLILRWRFGLSGEREHTLDEVGGKLGIARERVRQLEARALSKLRNTLPEELGAFYHEVREHEKETEARDDKEKQERYRKKQFYQELRAKPTVTRKKPRKRPHRKPLPSRDGRGKPIRKEQKITVRDEWTIPAGYPDRWWKRELGRRRNELWVYGFKETERFCALLNSWRGEFSLPNCTHLYKALRKRRLNTIAVLKQPTPAETYLMLGSYEEGSENGLLYGPVSHDLM